MASHDIPIGSTQVSLAQLSDRSRDIFRQIVESYLATGEPVGSRNISRLLQMSLSPASVRNVMSDLEQLGLIYAPHTSAGRLPTELGLRFFVDALMQIGDINDNDKRAIEAQVAGRGQSYENVLTQASGLLSGLTRAAGVVLTAKLNVVLKHIEFVRLEPERARERSRDRSCLAMRVGAVFEKISVIAGFWKNNQAAPAPAASAIRASIRSRLRSGCPSKDSSCTAATLKRSFAMPTLRCRQGDKNARARFSRNLQD